MQFDLYVRPLLTGPICDAMSVSIATWTEFEACRDHTPEPKAHEEAHEVRSLPSARTYGTLQQRRKAECAEAGIDFAGVRQLYRQLRELDREKVHRLRRLRLDAIRSLGLSVLSKELRTCEDSHSLIVLGHPLDTVARELANSRDFGDLIAGSDPVEFIFQLVTSGHPKPRPGEQLWREAFDQAYTDTMASAAKDDSVPFSEALDTLAADGGEESPEAVNDGEAVGDWPTEPPEPRATALTEEVLEALYGNGPTDVLDAKPTKAEDADDHFVRFCKLIRKAKLAMAVRSWKKADHYLDEACDFATDDDLEVVRELRERTKAGRETVHA